MTCHASHPKTKNISMYKHAAYNMRVCVLCSYVQCSHQYHNPLVIPADDLTAYKHENTMQKEPELMQSRKILPACAVKSIFLPPDKASEDENTRERCGFSHSCLDGGENKSLPMCLFCLQTTINLSHHTTTTLYWTLSNQTLLGKPNPAC